MANLDSQDQKIIKKDFAIVESTEELDKFNDNSAPEDDISPVLLVLFSIIPIVILIILFM